MNSKYLFPHSFRKYGYLILIPSLIIGVGIMFLDFKSDFFDVSVFAVASKFIGGKEYFSVIENNILDELVSSGFIVGLILVALSKEKNEDEYLSKIRLESLIWATYVNYGILLLTIIFVYELSFFTVLVMNMYTLLIFFLIRFSWKKIELRKSLSNEE